jgi:methylated-DNA-[protein]-cysteine S-methyltransferase
MRQLNSPFGTLSLVVTDNGLCRLTWGDEPDLRPSKDSAEVASSLLTLATEAETQLQAYFTGMRTSFDLPLSLSGTAFQTAVWRALLTIPYGETRSYQEIAEQIGNPRAVRAVGQANRLNPLAVIIPCHRVIGKDGALTGYMGAASFGLNIKQRLLALESARWQSIDSPLT